jgi:hypothetical protein
VAREPEEFLRAHEMLLNGELHPAEYVLWLTEAKMLGYLGGPVTASIPRQSDSAAEKARQGNPADLISYILTGGVLSPAAAAVVVEALEKKPRQPYRALRQSVRALRITFEVERRMREGTKKEAAIAEVKEVFHCSRRYVFDAMKLARRHTTELVQF